MAFSRAAALRSAFRATRPTLTVRSHIPRQVARRGYASGGHGSSQAGGDAVWAAGAIAVTVPSCWYLLQNAPDTSHGHGDHGDHGESHGESHGEEKEDETEEKSKDEEKSEDKEDSESDSDSDSKEADTPDTSDDEGAAEEESGSDEKNTKKIIPDAKGSNKKRIESKQGKKQGELEDPENDTDDEAAASKPAGGKNTQSGKQEGLSNTDTKHSTDIENNPDKSKKGEGAPETAKVKGTVDPNRPQLGSKQ
jgi:hypothetical protein